MQYCHIFSLCYLNTWQTILLLLFWNLQCFDIYHILLHNSTYRCFLIRRAGTCWSLRAECVCVCVWSGGWSAWPGRSDSLRAAATGRWSAGCCWWCSPAECTPCSETAGWPRRPSSSPWRCASPRRNEARNQRAGRNELAPAGQRRKRAEHLTSQPSYITFYRLPYWVNLLFSQSSPGRILWDSGRIQSCASNQCWEWCLFLF